jgi:poly-beta-1,6-N-acetyl-D-glucosamine synthase
MESDRVRMNALQWTATIVFLFSALLVLYILFGYPLLLAWRARRGSRPIRKQWQPRTVSVLLPVYNGERWIRAKLESILALHYPQELIEIIVVSDGSTDRTAAIVREFASPRIRLFELPRGGKALALNAALREASGEILFLTDVRQALHPDALRNLVACFADPEIGVASGELMIVKGETLEEANVGLYWRYEKWIRERLSEKDSVIGATGAIYAMRRELAIPLPPDTLLDDVYLPVSALFQGYRVILDRTAYAYDYPTSLDAEFRRKVRTLAGNYQLIGFFPQLMRKTNRLRFDFLSHKFACLLLPHLMILLALSSFGLPAPWSWIALSAQGLFYLLALLDTTLPEGFPLKRLTSPIRAFVVLLAAAFCAASYLFFGTRNLWKETRVRPAELEPPPAA